MPECGSVNDLVHYMAPKINSKLTEAYPVSCTSPVTSCSFSCLNSPEAYIINDGCAKIVDAQFCVDRSSNNSVMISDSSKGHKNPGDDMNTKGKLLVNNGFLNVCV